MDISVVTGDITKVEADAAIVNLFKGVKRPGGATGAVDKALGGAISGLIADGEITGKKGEIVSIHTLGRIKPKRVVVAGLGEREKFSLDTVREIMGGVSRHLRVRGVKKMATIVHGAGIGGMDPSGAAQAIAEGSLLGLYRFTRHRGENDEDKGDIEELHIVEVDPTKVPALESGRNRGKVMAEATMMARDMANEPANFMTPSHMADVARQVAQESGLELEVLEQEQMEELGMGAILGVAKGTHEPAKLIILRYRGDQDDPSRNLGLVGKGVTFDSGGISLKPAANMGEMKGDMSGGASVIAAMGAIGQLKPKVNVTGLIPASENLPGGNAQKPGDVVKAMNGKTIEIENTDAEGRLLLADALSYGRKLGLSSMVDVATLTGAIVIALGHVTSGAFGNDQALVDRVIEAGKAAGEKIWQMPMFDEYKEQNKSDVADMKNTGGRPAGSITAAQFLAEFSEDTPWVHLDIAGTFMAEKNKGYITKGATGVPVRTLINYVLGSATS
ncbi:MAG: leucyl aminopeptidase [Dehalococcoidia bacterium]